MAELLRAEATTARMSTNLAWAASPMSRSWSRPTGKTGSRIRRYRLRGASRQRARPGAILLRRTDKQARSLAAVILANLEQVTDDLAAGALIVISDTRIRARRLPMKPSD